MIQNMWGNQETKLFLEIGPDEILRCVDSVGLRSTGRVMALNSLENRVYEVELERPLGDQTGNLASDRYVVIKFYRPGRWDRSQILEEHQFLFDLLEHEIPVIAPLSFNNESLFLTKEGDINFALFPKRGGRNPDEFSDEMLQILGRTLARIHQIGKTRQATHRLKLDPQTYGRNNLSSLLSSKLIHPHHVEEYQELVEKICKKSDELFKEIPVQRIHGDCHRGNILWRPEGLFILDFDDMVIGPPVQDIWLVTPGRDEESVAQRNIFLEAYEEFHHFDYSTLRLVEPLRSLRFIHFAAWIGKRFNDESFKKAFYWYGTEHYWREQVNDLRDQWNIIGQLS
ncbi:MAG: serine/threonine protein kinase [Bacteriovoracaceae bacterium]|nr:serine/threonine protein kinase [Bacteriovoracaceae bacterium]